MKLEFNAIPVSVGKREAANGKLYYSISVDSEGELLTFDTNEEVFNGVKKYVPAHFCANYMKGEYQGRTYTRFTVVSMSQQK